jgi:hypothetical protein
MKIVIKDRKVWAKGTRAFKNKKVYNRTKQKEEVRNL